MAHIHWMCIVNVDYMPRVRNEVTRMGWILSIGINTLNLWRLYGHCPSRMTSVVSIVVISRMPIV